MNISIPDEQSGRLWWHPTRDVRSAEVRSAALQLPRLKGDLTLLTNQKPHSHLPVTSVAKRDSPWRGSPLTSTDQLPRTTFPKPSLDAFLTSTWSCPIWIPLLVSSGSANQPETSLLLNLWPIIYNSRITLLVVKLSLWWSCRLKVNRIYWLGTQSTDRSTLSIMWWSCPAAKKHLPT